jgi:hypothetical protein
MENVIPFDMPVYFVKTLSTKVKNTKTQLHSYIYSYV